MNPGEGEILDLDRNRSVPVGPPPHGRLGPRVFALEGGRALIVGGGYFGVAFPSAIELYDPDSNTITVVATLPHTRGFTVAETRAEILLVGDETGFLLNPRTFHLRPVPTVSVGRPVSLADGTVLMLTVEWDSPGIARFLLPPPARRRIARRAMEGEFAGSSAADTADRDSSVDEVGAVARASRPR